FFASLRFALKRMFDKTVENRNGFVNNKYNSTPCHSDRREESININRTPMISKNKNINSSSQSIVEKNEYLFL
ncbi:MAG: hypothetical protein RBR13_04775, partial [Tenuifilaceae bacterium]|nr:hypothetical protein [Tenuifilaceae bacterium]